ncbi:MAG: helix-turn-helix transcriptional regulator [Ruminococcus sp.]|nr:helix-turn-helix transcriptional regulator [Ruminococcus sp.]
MVKNRIKKFRTERWDMSQAELSDMLPGKPGKTVLSLIENGHVLPTPETMASLCAIFSCSPSDLYDESDLRFVDNGGDLDGGDRITVKVSQEFLEALEELGYSDAKEWLHEVRRNLLKERDIRRASTMTFTN